jgi:hypothetical protein
VPVLLDLLADEEPEVVPLGSVTVEGALDDEKFWVDED